MPMTILGTGDKSMTKEAKFLLPWPHTPSGGVSQQMVPCQLVVNAKKQGEAWEGDWEEGLLLNLDGRCHMTQDAYTMAPF